VPARTIKPRPTTGGTLDFGYKLAFIGTAH
jgi:hypothetical protein